MENNTNRKRIPVVQLMLAAMLLVSVVFQNPSYAYEAQADKNSAGLVIEEVRKPKIAITQGHGEADSIDIHDFVNGLKEHFEVSFVRFGNGVNTFHDTTIHDGKIRNNFDAIVMIGPDSAFTEKQLFILDQFIMYGGKALFCIDGTSADMDSIRMNGSTLIVSRHYGNAGAPGLEDLLFAYGARLNTDVVQDMLCSQLAIPVGSGPGIQMVSVPWVYSPTILPSQKDGITDTLGYIKFDFLSSIDTVATKGSVRKKVLLHSSKNSRVGRVPARATLASAMVNPDPKAFNDPYQPVAVLLEGYFSSYYRNRPQATETGNSGYLNAGLESGIIVIGDGDLALNPVHMGNALPLGIDRMNRLNKNFYANKAFLMYCVNCLLKK